MKLSSLTAFLALTATTSADFLRIPVTRFSPGAVTRREPHPRLSKRASFTESLANNITGGGYYASVTVGTPGQAFDLVLDTGSSDAFLIAKDADLCESRISQAAYQTTCGQTFDPSLSSTYQVAVPGGFQIEYLDGSTASGDYILDKFNIGGATINALQMGLADKTATGTGVLGIGFTADEATPSEYPNLIDQMLNQNLIPTRAYSLYLNDYSSSTGNILFGGVDTQKFIGEIAVVPILPDAQTQNYTSFTINMTALSLSFANGTAYSADTPGGGGGLDAILDSGTTLSYLPDDLAAPLFTAVGAYAYGSSFRSSAASELALVDCALAGSGLDITFRFGGDGGGASITVPADELVIDAFDQSEIPEDVPFEETCLFGIQNSGGGDSREEAQTSYALLGDTFLRSAYVVYDIDNRQVGLAQANLNSTRSDVQGLSSADGAAGLPVYTGVAEQEQGPSASGTVSSTGTGTSTNTAGSSSTAAGGTGTLPLISSGVAGGILTASVGTATDSSEVVWSTVATGTSTRAGDPCHSGVSSSFSSLNSSGVIMSSVDIVLVSSSVSAVFTNKLIASSTANAAAPLGWASGNGTLSGVLVALAFAVCGGLSFWL